MWFVEFLTGKEDKKIFVFVILKEKNVNALDPCFRRDDRRLDSWSGQE